MTSHITIIGAGIGGLTTAPTLKQKGFDVSVYEAAAEIKPVGAGIVLAINAMQVMRKLGLQERLAQARNCLSLTLRMTTPNLGQGACQAIKDAYVLGMCLEQQRDVQQLFSTTKNCE